MNRTDPAKGVLLRAHQFFDSQRLYMPFNSYDEKHDPSLIHVVGFARRKGVQFPSGGSKLGAVVLFAPPSSVFPDIPILITT